MLCHGSFCSGMGLLRQSPGALAGNKDRACPCGPCVFASLILPHHCPLTCSKTQSPLWPTGPWVVRFCRVLQPHCLLLALWCLALPSCLSVPPLTPQYLGFTLAGAPFPVLPLLTPLGPRPSQAPCLAQGGITLGAGPRLHQSAVTVHLAGLG